MSSEGEKVRTSGEVSRPEPTLPTVNPAAEKSQPPKAALHPAIYVTCVALLLAGEEWHEDEFG
jgi:hypothetical protein